MPSTNSDKLDRETLRSMVSVEKVTVLNERTGAVDVISRKIYEHPVFNNGDLVEVAEGTKPYVPELFKSRLTEPAKDPVDEPVEDDDDPELDEEEDE